MRSYLPAGADGPSRDRKARLVMRRVLAVVAGVVALQLALIGPAQAARGDLDPRFGAGGKVVADLPGVRDEAMAVAVQPDGKVVAGGYTSTPATTTDFVLTRYQVDGSPDPSFGDAGKVTFDFTGTGNNDQINAITLQPDGKIVVAGSADAGFALARFQPDGTLDPSFGDAGKVTTIVGGIFSQGNAAALQPDGAIVVVGDAITENGFDFAVARYLPDGSLDPSFGQGGTVTSDFFAGLDKAHALALQPDGKLVVSGQVRGGGGASAASTVVRYLPDGSLDPGFGSGGKVITDVGGRNISEARAVAVQADGKIVTAGNVSSQSAGSLALARYLADGSLDSKFGDHGTLILDGPGVVSGNALVIQPDDGKIVIGGTSRIVGTDLDFTLFRLTPQGRLDRGFGSSGKVVTDFGSASGSSNNDIVHALALHNDGRLVAAGSVNGTLWGEPNSFGLASYRTK